MKQRLIWCIALGTVVATAALIWLGVSPWTLALAAVLFACPAAILGGALYVHRVSRHRPSRAR